MSYRNKNIKVVLVSPSQKFLMSPLASEPLGLMYIEGVLVQMGITVEMVDMTIDAVLPQADIYGFYASTIHIKQVIKYAQQVSPSYTILGGPHASALPKESLNSFDAVIVGPGETAIKNVIDDYCSTRSGGVFYADHSDINNIPIPPRNILNRIPYDVCNMGTRSSSIITSRGCPYKCSFCASNTIWGRKVQFRSIANVVKEINYLKNEFGINHFKFVDDIFTLNKSRFKDFADILSQLDISWTCNTRVDAITDEVLNQLIKSHCSTVDLGVESVSDITLKKIQKNQTVEMAKLAIKKIKSYGIKVKLYLIYGLPFETKSIVQQTMDFIFETKPDYVSLFTLVPYPGTDIWLNPKKYNISQIDVDFGRYQHSVGNIDEELDWLPNMEYFDRTKEQLRSERNKLKQFVLKWNRHELT